MIPPNPRIYTKVGFDAKDAALCIFSLRQIKADDRRNLFSLFCEIIKDKCFSLKPLETSLASFGLIKTRHKNPDLLKQLRMHAFNKATHFTPHEALYLLRAYVFTKGVGASKDKDRFTDNRKLVKAFRPIFLKKMNELSGNQIVELASIFNELNLSDPEFFDALKERFNHVLEQTNLTYFETGRATKLFCEAGGENDHVLHKLLNRIVNHLEAYDLNDLCAIAYCVLIKRCQNDKYSSDYDAFILDILKKIVNFNFDDIILPNLHNLKTILTYLSLTKKIDADLRLRLEEKIGNPKILQHSFPSSLHKNIENRLTPLLKPIYKIENEYPFCNFNIDMAIPEIKLAIEIDGWSHFDESGNYLPKTKLKNEVLRLSGWSVVRIRGSEWPHREEKRIPYLIEKLEEFDILNPELKKNEYQLLKNKVIN